MDTLPTLKDAESVPSVSVQACEFTTPSPLRLQVVSVVANPAPET